MMDSWTNIRSFPVQAVAPDPLDRVTYFMYSSGGSDLFFIDSVTGEIRSRMALTIGTYAFDVAARDFAGRTAIMKLEVAITPSCLRPQMMDFLPDDSRFPSRALSSSRSLGMGPQFERHTYTFPIPSVLTSTTAIGQVKVCQTFIVVKFELSKKENIMFDRHSATREISSVTTFRLQMISVLTQKEIFLLLDRSVNPENF